MIASDPAPAGPLFPTPTKPVQGRQGSDPGRDGTVADFDAVLGDAEAPTAGKAVAIDHAGREGSVAGVTGRARRGDLRAVAAGEESDVPAAAPPAEAVPGIVPAVTASETVTASGVSLVTSAVDADADRPGPVTASGQGVVAEVTTLSGAASEPAPDGAAADRKPPDAPTRLDKPLAEAELSQTLGMRQGDREMQAPPARELATDPGRKADAQAGDAAAPVSPPSQGGTTAEAAVPVNAGATAGATPPVTLVAQPVLEPGWQLSVQPAAATDRAGDGALSQAATGTAGAVTAQVSVAIARSAGGTRKVELRLDPPELGRVEIHLSPSEKGGLQASVVAERSETHALLRRHADVLARELGEAGYADVSLSFAAGGDAAASGGRSPGPSPHAGSESFALMANDLIDPVAAPLSSRTGSAVEGGLDIRL